MLDELTTCAFVATWTSLLSLCYILPIPCMWLFRNIDYTHAQSSTKWSHKIFFSPFCVHLGWFTWNSKEQKAVCKAHNRLEQCKNEVRFLNILHFNHTPHPTIFQIFFMCRRVCVCVVRSQASTGPQAKQDGLREEMEEAWRKLESIKVQVFKSVWNQWRRLDLWPFAVVSIGPVLCRPVSLCN